VGTREKRGQEELGSGISKVVGSGRNTKNYTTLHNILQSKRVKRWELAKNGAGNLRIEGYGKWEFEPPVTCTY